jgi:hypothetical protein
MKKFPGLPKEIWEIIESILEHIKGAQDKPKAVADVRRAVRACIGPGCPIDVVK